MLGDTKNLRYEVGVCGITREGKETSKVYIVEDPIDALKIAREDGIAIILGFSLADISLTLPK